MTIITEGNSTTSIAGNTHNVTVGQDFAKHDLLPPRLRAWYHTSRVLWSAADAYDFLRSGWSEDEILRWLRDCEKRALQEDRTPIWGKDYPTEHPIETSTPASQKEQTNAKANPLPGLRRSPTLIHKQVARRGPRRRPTDRWGASGT